MIEKVFIRSHRAESEYEISVGTGLLADCGNWVGRSLKVQPLKLVIVSNTTVHGLYGDAAESAFRRSGYEVFVHLIGDGEGHKNFETLEKTLAYFSSVGLTRTDAVVALGGGVVGDLAGFAASVYLRGVALLQVPTTLLAMIDSSVGGKTAINTAFGKNLIGTFYQPDGVLIDVDTLATLAEREMTAGLCEAIKQGAVGGGDLFDATVEFLDSDKRDALALVSLVAAQTAFKAAVVEGDEHEDPANMSANSRKILNFGHTFAHAIEKLTDYKYFRHGEAVGHGILFAALLSNKLEILGSNEVKLLNDVVRRAGSLPPIDKIDPASIFESFKFDKKLVNGSLQWAEWCK